MNTISYGSHLPVLLKIISMTAGDVLELGTGPFSTPVIHYLCVESNRRLVSLDNNKNYISMWKQYRGEFHQVKYIASWDDAQIEKDWDVVLVDHAPAQRRAVEIKRLASFGKYLIVHDASGRWDNVYHYSTIYPLFKYKKIWDKEHPHTAVLSNFVNLENLW